MKEREEEEEERRGRERLVHPMRSERLYNEHLKGENKEIDALGRVGWRGGGERGGGRG